MNFLTRLNDRIQKALAPEPRETRPSMYQLMIAEGMEKYKTCPTITKDPVRRRWYLGERVLMPGDRLRVRFPNGTSEDHIVNPEGEEIFFTMTHKGQNIEVRAEGLRAELQYS